MSSKTVSDVALAAGVGVGTVSRVINGSEMVSATTAQRVQDAMKQIGYTPPPLGSRRGPQPGSSRQPNKHVKQSVLMLLCGGYDLRSIMSCAPIYAYVVHAVESELGRAARNLVIRQAPRWDSLHTAVKQSQAGGVILLGREPDEPMPPILKQIPAVWVMGQPRHFDGDHVLPNHIRVGQLAADCMLQQGHRHCAYVGDREPSSPPQLESRKMGFRMRIEQAGGSVLYLTDPNVVIKDDTQHTIDEQRLERLIDQLMAADPRPTAIMLQTDVFARPIYRQLEAKGLRPQHDIAIVTCNNERVFLSGLEPAPYVVDLQAEAIGRRAVDQLFWRQKHPNDPAMRIMVQPSILGPSTASPEEK